MEKKEKYHNLSEVVEKMKKSQDPENIFGIRNNVFHDNKTDKPH